LTSFDNDSFKKIYGKGIDEKVEQFTYMVMDSGLDGVVCSAFESEYIKLIAGDDFLTLCPAIRPFGEDAGDQSRVATIEFAKKAKVDFPVIGRPIYKDANPAKKVKDILRMIG